MGIKKGDTIVLAGTRKGLFVAASKDRRKWRVAPWGFEGTEVHHAMLGPDARTVWAGVTSGHWGPSVQRRDARKGKWAATGAIKFPEKGGLSVERVWHVAAGADGALYAGVEPAGLFRSEDDGATWASVSGFNDRPERASWMPGGGGLCLHTVLPHPTDARRMVVAASAVGIFGTTDGGASWRVMNGGIRADHLPEGKTAEDQLGTCPHKLVRDPAEPDTLYMQNHWGVYRRRDGDAEWTPIQTGLPGRFGFPMAAHARAKGTVFTFPLTGDFNRVAFDGKPAVYKTTDGGKRWSARRKGLPEDAWWTVLREGLAVDASDPLGVYFGTTTGQLYGSRDEGESWKPIADGLPPILSVRAGIAG